MIEKKTNKIKDRRPGYVKTSAKKEEEFESEVLDLTRVTRVTAGGKRLRFRAAVAIGNKKGRVGLGVSKGADVTQAIEKARKKAEKSLMDVPIFKDSIPHEVQAKFGAAKVLLKPQAKGRGLVAGGVIRTLCNLAGIRNISAKIISRTKNKINNAKATMEAFGQLKLKTPQKTENAISPIKTKK